MEGQLEISGGQFESLVSQIFKELNNALPNVHKSSCEGAVADGQYITKSFQSPFFAELGVQQDLFSFIVRDPSHFLDLLPKSSWQNHT